MKILVVDDAQDIRLLLTRTLQLAGYRDVTAVATGEEALQFLATGADAGEPGDLVLLDLGLPGLDGISVCARIKEDPRLQDVPVLMVTAQPETQQLEAAFAAGASDYIAKPFDRRSLLARVRQAIRLKREIDRRKAREAELLETQELLKQANAALFQLARVDALTGIPNRRYFDEALEREWERAQHSGGPLAMLLLDVDRFKQFNDRYGHAGGDECLKTIARCLTGIELRAGDFAARYGGEEFAVLLPGLSGEQAALIGERLRTSVERLAITHADSAAEHVTVSVGVGAIPPPLGSPAELVSRTDAALYRAKLGGRNRVEGPGEYRLPSTSGVGSEIAMDPGKG